jgi:hypothetical protein
MYKSSVLKLADPLMLVNPSSMLEEEKYLSGEQNNPNSREPTNLKEC